MALAVAALLAACAAPELPQPAALPPEPAPAPTLTPSFQQIGLASWYGPELDHHRTASGERFNMNELDRKSVV